MKHKSTERRQGSGEQEDANRVDPSLPTANRPPESPNEAAKPSDPPPRHLSLWQGHGSKVRPKKQSAVPAPGPGCATTERSGSSCSPPGETFGELVERANEGDKPALKRLRHLLDERPEIWQTAGDLGRHVEENWIEMMAAGSALMRESLVRTVVEKKDSLLGPNPTAIERLVVDQIIACWLETQFYRTRADNGASVAQGALWLKRLDSSQKRYVSSMRWLTDLRALLPRGLVPLNPYTPHQTARGGA